MKRGSHGVAAGLFVLVWLSCVWFGSWPLNPNNATRLFGAIALVENGTPTIDRFESLTIDKAHFGRHHYMDKAPGMTLLAIPTVWIVDHVTHRTARDEVIDITDPHFARFMKLRLAITVALTSALLTASAAVLLFDLATGVTGSVEAGLFAALGYALGSVVWGWSTTVLGHAPIAALVTIAVWAVWRGTSDPRALKRWRYPLIAGAALGWAVVVEFPTALATLAIGLWALWRTRHLDWRSRVRLYVPVLIVALAMLVPLALYNQVAFGTPFRLGYEGVTGFDGMQQGLFGLTYPKPTVLFKLLFGSRRGLFWVAPVLLLGIPGLALLIRRSDTRDLGLLALGIVIVVLMVNASYVYWDGGASTGPRHSVPAIPFLALGLASLWVWLRGQRWHRAWHGVAAALLGLSMAINLIVAATDIFAPEDKSWPFWQSNLPMLARGAIDTVANSWWDWAPWRGIALYLVVALPLLWLMARAARFADRDV